MPKEKVLVVDDDESIRIVLDEFLRGEGYDVFLAESGKKAVDMFSGTRYSVIFMDMKILRMDVVEALKLMKKKKPDTRVIVITGLPDDVTFERIMAISEGAVERFIPKPFKPRDLRKALRERKEEGSPHLSHE